MEEPPRATDDHGRRVPSTPSHFLDPKFAGSVNRLHVLVVNAMAMWITAFMSSSVNVALPSIQTDLRLGAVALGWVPLAYVLSSAVLLVPFGRLADLFGRRLAFLCGLTLFFISAAALAFVDSFVVIIVLRVLQGIGGATMFATSTAMVALVYPLGERGKAMGIMVTCVYIGHAMGPVVGGVLTSNLGWHAIFAFAAILSLVILLLDLVLLRRADWKERTTGFDLPGSIAYAVALAALLAGLSLLPQTGGIVLAALGVVGLAVFTWWETRAPAPVLDVRLFRRNRAFSLSNLASLASYAAVTAMTMLMSLYLQFIRGLDAQTAGFILISGVIVQALLSPFAGRLSDRIQPRYVSSAGMALTTAGLLGLSFLGARSPYGMIVGILVALGLGYAFFGGPNQNAIMSSVKRHQLGTASATLATARMVGQALSVAVATLVIAAIVGRQELQPVDYPALLVAIRVAFVVLAAICALGVAASLARGPLPAGERTTEVKTAPPS